MISSFFIPGPCCAIHTLISPDVHIFVRSTVIGHYGYLSNDVEVFKRGSQVICMYGTICVVSASSSPVSRVISEPKEVRSFHEVGLPIWLGSHRKIRSAADRKCELQLIKITIASMNLKF